MPNKSHKNCVELHKSTLEKEFNYRCRKEYPIPVNGLLHELDLACFRNECPSAVVLEAESITNFNTPAVKSNAEDIRTFRQIFGEHTTKGFHINVNDIIDFEKELVCDIPIKKPITLRPQNKYNIPKKKISLGW